MVIWLIGLSGAGKTTLATLLYDRLKAGHPNLVLLDGDNLRDVWGDNLGHTVAARNTNAHRISHLCRLLDSQGIHVVAAVLSMFPEWQAWNRANFSRYFEIFLDVPMTELRRRDQKQLYSQAERGMLKNVVGVDLQFPVPAKADLRIAGDDSLQPPEAILKTILQALPAEMRAT